MYRIGLLCVGLWLGGCATSAPLPPKAMELNRLGVAALEQGDLAAAEARLALALEYHPRFVEALVNLGLVEVARGNHDRARALFHRARSVNADLPHPHHGLGVLAHKQGRAADAAAHYRQALAVDPGFLPSRANLGRLHFDAGSLDDAREQFARLVEASPADERGHAGLIETLLRQGRRDDAHRALDRARQAAGEPPAIALLMARRLLELGAVAQATAQLRSLADAHHEVATSARAWLAVAALAAGDADEAIRQAERALAADRHEPVATFALAAALEQKNDPSAPAWRRRVEDHRRLNPAPWPK